MRDLLQKALAFTMGILCFVVMWYLIVLTAHPYTGQVRPWCATYLSK